MKELSVNRILDEATIINSFVIDEGNEICNVHMTHNNEIIFTDPSNKKIYALLTYQMYNILF